MIQPSLPARTLSDQHTILRLPARISYGVGTSCPNTPNPRPAPVPHVGSNTTNWLSKRIMLRYSKSGPATAQPRSPSISGVMPIHPIGSYDRSGALDTTGKRRFPGCFPQASRPTAQDPSEPVRQVSLRHDISSQLELSRRNRATSRSSSPWSLSGQASPTGSLLTPDHVASGGTSFVVAILHVCAKVVFRDACAGDLSRENTPVLFSR